MPFFICPNCGNRELSSERTVGFSTRPKGCSKCGFGFLFELLDDYYPAPGAAFFTCDKDGRLLDLGKNAFELTGLKDEDVIGRPVTDVLGLSGWTRSRPSPAPTRRAARAPTRSRRRSSGESAPSGKKVAVHAEGDLPTEAVADVFPAYDDDGGLLLVLTPE